MMVKKRKPVKSVTNDFLTITKLLGILYVVGETSQWLVIGPNWFRWHVSDFGFVFSFAPALNYFLKDKYASAVFAWLFATAFELAQYMMIGSSCDWIDILMFAISLVILFIIEKNFAD